LERTVADERCVLLFDGVFLLRPELSKYWDLSIYLHVEPEIALERGAERDSRHMGGRVVARDLYLNRYLRGQALYQAQASPTASADVVVDNTDLKSPRVTQTPS
jgi:uridine kinase